HRPRGLSPARTRAANRGARGSPAHPTSAPRCGPGRRRRRPPRRRVPGTRPRSLRCADPRCAACPTRRRTPAPRRRPAACPESPSPYPPSRSSAFLPGGAVTPGTSRCPSSGAAPPRTSCMIASHICDVIYSGGNHTRREGDSMATGITSETTGLSGAALGFTDEQIAFQKAVTDFCRRECGTREQRDELTEGGTVHHNEALYRKMADLGWLGLTVPESYGGS